MKTYISKKLTASLLGILLCTTMCNAEIKIVTEDSDAADSKPAATKAEPASESSSNDEPKTKPEDKNNNDEFKGYDFGDVVDKVKFSIAPLKNEMTGNMKQFSDSVKKAEELMDKGEAVEAINTYAEAIKIVLAERDKVLEPMWEGQVYLQDQIGKVSERLASSAEANNENADKEVNPRTESVLNNIAKRISSEKDPTRKKRLIRHYKTISKLAKIRSMKDNLTPSQHKMWQNVLGVLKKTRYTHKRVYDDTDILFFQLEGTLQYIQDSKDLIETVEGANKLLEEVRGLDQSGDGLYAFTDIMDNLQGSLDGLTDEFDLLMDGNIEDLNVKSDAINSELDLKTGESSSDIEIPDELAERIKKLN